MVRINASTYKDVDIENKELASKIRNLQSKLISLTEILRNPSRAAPPGSLPISTPNASGVINLDTMTQHAQTTVSEMDAYASFVQRHDPKLQETRDTWAAAQQKLEQVTIELEQATAQYHIMNDSHYSLLEMFELVRWLDG